MKNYQRNLLTLGIMLAISAAILFYMVFLQSGLCDALMNSGASSCDAKARIGYFLSEPVLAAIFLVVSIGGGLFVYIAISRFFDGLSK